MVEIKFYVQESHTHIHSAHLFRATDHSHLVDALTGAEAPQRIHVYDPYCPVHGSRRRLRHFGGKISTGHRLVDMHSIFASVESGADGDEDEKLNPYLQRLMQVFYCE